MTVAVLRISLALPSRTLKEKRSIVKSVVERLRARYNVSVAEVEDLDNPLAATIAAACVSNDAAHAAARLQSVADAVARWRLDAEVIDVSTELIQV